MPQFVKVKGRVATEHITKGSTGGAQISKLPVSVVNVQELQHCTKTWSDYISVAPTLMTGQAMAGPFFSWLPQLTFQLAPGAVMVECGCVARAQNTSRWHWTICLKLKFNESIFWQLNVSKICCHTLCTQIVWPSSVVWYLTLCGDVQERSAIRSFLSELE